MSQDILETIINKLSQMNHVVFLVEVGLSRNRKKPKNKDLLMAIETVSIEEQFQNILLAIQSISGEITTIRNDDALIMSIGELVCGVAVYAYQDLENFLLQWNAGLQLEGQKRNWAIGYWLPEAMCADIVTAKTIIDVNDSFSNFQKNVKDSYNARIAAYIVTFCELEIFQKSTRYLALKSKTDKKIEVNICLADIQAASLRWIFAKEKIFLRGFYQIEIQKKQLPEIALAFIEFLELYQPSQLEELHKRMKEYKSSC